VKIIRQISVKSIVIIVAFTMLALFLPFSNKIQSLSNKTEKEKFFDPIIQKLLVRGVSQEFINKILSDKRTEFQEKLAKINVSQNSSINNNSAYDKLSNEKSIKKSKEFLAENIEILQSAESKFGVPKEIITSLLWIETKHGDYLGNNHLPSVFLSVAMAGDKDYYAKNVDNLKSTFIGNSDELPEMLSKLEQRTKKKVDWALNELVALEKLDKVSPKPVLELYGSWAGAFGMSQFLPSSYLVWGFDGNEDGQIDLFNKVDAIYSVGNYLKSNGWSVEPEKQRMAIFHYNNSTSYVNAVLNLAEKIKQS